MEPQGEELKRELKKFYQGRKLFYGKLYKTKTERQKEKEKAEAKSKVKSSKKKKEPEDEEEVKGKVKELFKYSDEGDLETYDRKGELINVVKTNYYRPPTLEEIDEAEQKRLTAIAEAQEAFEQARRELRDLIETPEPSQGDILRLNRKVMEADMELQSVRFGEKTVFIYESIDTNKILLDEPGEVRKMFNVISFAGRALTLQEQYVREGRNVPQNVLEAAQLAENMRRTRKAARAQGVIFFKLPDTNEFGYMTMEWPVIFTYNGTRYKSVKHALYGELAKNFKDMAMFGRIQSTEDPEALMYNYSDSKGVTKEQWDSKRAELIQKVNREKFKQNPELGEKLLSTGDVVLAADVIDDTLFGIGRSMEDPKAMKPRKWTGQNLLGKTIEKIRNELRKERQVAEAVQVEAATNAVVTEAVTDAITEALPEGSTEAVAEAASTVAEQAADVAAATMSAIKSFVAPTSEPASAPTPAPAPAPEAAPKKRTLRIIRPIASVAPTTEEA